MVNEKKRSWFYSFCDIISDPGIRKDRDTSYNIFPLRIIVSIFVFLVFHVYHGYSDLFSGVVIAELLYIVSIKLLFEKPSKENLELRFLKVATDFVFVTYFQYLSLSLYGHSSGIFVLYFMPLIYCSFWFNRLFTFIFASFVSLAYLLLNLHFFDPNITALSYIADTMLATVIVFYWVAIGIVYFKKKIQLNYDDIQEIADEHKSQLSIEKSYSLNLFKRTFDGIIVADENGKVIDINERACEILEYRKVDILKKNVRIFYELEEGKRIMLKLRSSDDGAVENFKTYLRNSMGDKIPILLSAVFHYDRAEIPNLKDALRKGIKFPSIGFFRDIRAEEMIDALTTDDTSKDMEELFEKMVKNIAKILRAEVCSLLTYKDRIGVLKVKKSFGLPEKLKETELFEVYGDAGSMIGKIFNEKKTLNVTDIDVRNKTPNNQNIKWGYAKNFADNSRYKDFKHFLGVPLIVYGEVYGVIRVLNKYTNNGRLDKFGFTKSDEKLLERISNQVSVMVGKKRDQQRFQALSQVGRELNEKVVLSIEDLLETIAMQAVLGMRIKACYLRLIEEAENLVIKACYGLKKNYQGIKKYNIKIGKGIAGQVVKKGSYDMVSDLRNNPEFEHKEIIQNEGLMAMLSVPLKYGSKIIGVINCYTSRPHEFTEQEIRFMQTFAAYASIAIKNKARVDELYALNDVGRELVKPINIDELLNKILDKAKKISGVDRLCIKSYDKKARKLFTRHALNCRWFDKGNSEKYAIDVTKPPWKNIWLQIENSRQTQIVPNYQNILNQIDHLTGKADIKNVKSCAIVPIIINNEITGAIFLESFMEKFFQEEDNLPVLNSFSIQAAIALRNADLFGKLDKVTKTFSKISVLDSDIDEVMQNISDMAANVLETDIFLLYRWDEKEQRIIWPPIYSGGVRKKQFMLDEVGASDIPMDLIMRGVSHFAADSQKDFIMTSGGAPPKKGIPERFVFREGIKSSAGVILKVGQEIVGVMFINYRTPHKFDEDERNIIENYASYIAIAIQNVKHFQEKKEAAKMKTLGQFSTSLAHKIKNEISMISLYTSDLIDNTTKKSFHYDKLVDIKRKVNKIASDLESLRAVSKMEAPKKISANLREILDSVDQEIKADLKHQNIKLDIVVDGNIPNIEIDPVQIKMVLQNLVYNSFEAMPHGGRITTTLTATDNSISLTWADTGTGVIPENSEKIFEPLWTSKDKGSGLGLYLSRRIIEEHKGTITLDANSGEGAKFVIKFPIRMGAGKTLQN